jgi:hypothetical protein
MRPLRLTLALLAAVLAGVAGASAVLGSPAAGPQPAPARLQPDGSGAALPATAADPAGAPEPRWAVRVYRSEDGLSCPEAGRTVGGDFGRVDREGAFHPTRLEAAGSCADPAAAPYTVVVNHYAADGRRGARAVVFGLASARVQAITVTPPGGRAVPAAVTHGGYVLALPEDQAGGAQVAFALDDGTTKTITLQPAATLP